MIDRRDVEVHSAERLNLQAANSHLAFRARVPAACVRARFTSRDQGLRREWEQKY